MAKVTRREFMQGAAAAAGLAAAGCVPPPDQWFDKGKREASKERAADDREERLRKRKARAMQEQEVDRPRDWQDNSRIEAQPFLEEQAESWEDVEAAHRYYRKMERRFAFYGKYGGYDSFDHFLKEHPWLKKNSADFLEALESGETEKDYIPGIQAPAEYQEWFEKYGGKHEQFVTAIGAIETHFDQSKSGGDGEVGMMQIKPSTAEELGEFNLTDPEENITAAARYYNKMYEKAGNEWLALAGYNGGPGEIERVPNDSSPIDVVRTLEGQQRLSRDYVIKVAIVLDYMDPEDAKGLASKESIVDEAEKLRDKYNKQ